MLAISAVTASACGSPQAPARPARPGPTAAPPVSVVRDAGTGPPVWDVALASPGRAFAALSEGLATSANGGRSWAVSKLSSFPAPVSLDLVSGQVVFAAGHGQVLRTVDGGRTWQSLRPPAAGTYAVDFWTANAGVAMVPDRTGANSEYFVTRNGARTWRRLRIPGWALLGGGVPTAAPGGNLVQSSVCFAPGGTGWAVASRAGHVSLLVSPAGGRRWRVALPGLPPGPADDPAERPAAVAGCTEHSVWAVVTQWGQLGHLRAIDLLHTVNLGRSWLDVARGFFRFSGLHLLAVQAPPGGPMTLPTALNHVAWLTAPSPNAAWLGLIDSQGSAEGYASTSDGGRTWRLRSFPVSGVCPAPAGTATSLPAGADSLVALATLSARVAWILLAANVSAAPAYLYGTTNGGATWTEITRFGTTSQRRLPRTGTCSAGR